MIESFFLQTNFDVSSLATIFIAVGTMALATVTAYYAFQTRKTVEVMEKSAKLSIMPHIKGHLVTKSVYEVYFRISNVGKGPANNVKFSYWFESKPDDIKKWSNNLLMPNDSEEFLLFIPDTKHLIDLTYLENNPTKIIFQSLYFDIQGNSYFIDETLDASEYVKDWISSSQKINYDPLDKIAEEIRDIKNIMQSEQMQSDFTRQFSGLNFKKTDKKSKTK